jgi:hypothetical protein
VFLPQTRDVPDTYGLIERGGDNEIVLGVELRTHGVVVVTGHCTYLAVLGSLVEVALCDLLSDPMSVS